MVEKLIRYILAFVGLSIGIGFGIFAAEDLYVRNVFGLQRIVYLIAVPIFTGLLFGFVMYFASKLFIMIGRKLAQYAQQELEKIPPHDFLFGLI